MCFSKTAEEKFFSQMRETKVCKPKWVTRNVNLWCFMVLLLIYDHWTQRHRVTVRNLGESIKWKASGVKSIKYYNIRSFQILLWVEIWLNINGFQVVLLRSVLEEDIKAVKNAVVQLGRCKNPGRDHQVSIISSSVEHEVITGGT